MEFGCNGGYKENGLQIFMVLGFTLPEGWGFAKCGDDLERWPWDPPPAPRQGFRGAGCWSSPLQAAGAAPQGHSLTWQGCLGLFTGVLWGPASCSASPLHKGSVIHPSVLCLCPSPPSDPWVMGKLLLFRRIVPLAGVMLCAAPLHDAPLLNALLFYFPPSCTCACPHLTLLTSC